MSSETRAVTPVAEAAEAVANQSRHKVKHDNLTILRHSLKSVRQHGFATPSISALPRPLAITCGVFGGSYLLYKLLPGPSSLSVERNLTVTRFGSPLSLATYHATHTSLLGVAVNAYVMSTFGKFHWQTLGARSLMTVSAVGAVLASLATARAVSEDDSYTAAGANGISAALITFHAFRTPKLFGSLPLFRLAPVGVVALAALYSVKYNDQGLLAGIGGGYLAFLLGLF